MVNVIDFAKTHPGYSLAVVGGIVIIAAFSRSGNAGPSDAVQIAAINAQKDISIAQTEARVSSIASNNDLRKNAANVSAAKMGLQTALKASIFGDKTDLSKTKVTSGTQLKIDLSKIAADKALGLYGFDTERVKSADALKLGLAGVNAKQATEIKALSISESIARLGVDASRYIAKLTDDTRRAELAYNDSQFKTALPYENQRALYELMGVQDSNATSITRAKVATRAQNLQTGLGFLGDWHQADAGVASDFLGMVGDIFGGGSVGGGLFGGLFGGL